MKKFLGSVLILLSLSADCAMPTVEGLFRNSNNSKVEGDYVVLKLLVTPEQSKSLIDSTELPEKKYVKYIFSTENEGKVQVIQVGYKDSKMSTRSIESINYVGDVLGRIKTDSYTERSIFYSLLVMFGLNNSEGMKSIINKNSDKFISNENMMNADKVHLMDQYKKYLTAIKGDESLKEELISPLKPEEDEEKEKVKELVKAGMYKRSKQLSLVRKANSFFWKVDLDTVNAMFTNEEHRMSSLSVTTKEGTLVSADFGDYILFDGRHELPKFIFFTDSESSKFKIRVLSLKNFVNKGKSMPERYEEYQKFLAENEKRKSKITTDEDKLISDIKPEKIISRFYYY